MRSGRNIWKPGERGREGVGGGGGASIPMTPTSQYFHLFKVNLGTIIFAARKRVGGGAVLPSMMLCPYWLGLTLQKNGGGGG